MKTMKSKFYSLALAAGMLTLTACSDDNTNDSNNDKGNGIENGSILKGTITEDVTLKAGNTYKLSGEYIVEAGATLNIEEGVKIISVYDNIVDYILVKQGAKINAVGTPDKPIVMTSEKEEPGAWGGIHICGKAHTNAEGGKGSSEIGGAVYGGNDDADNSGTLQYIRLEYTGFAFDEEHEANGISFYGVGNGTIVDHCEAYKGSDDGFEFFGGSVNVSNMVVVSCSDDSFDWTEGWNGKGTDLVAYQEAKATLGYDCDCLIEADNNENDNAATPVSVTPTAAEPDAFTAFETSGNALFMLMPQDDLTGVTLEITYTAAPKDKSSEYTWNDTKVVNLTGSWGMGKNIRYTLTLTNNATPIKFTPNVGIWTNEDGTFTGL